MFVHFLFALFLQSYCIIFYANCIFCLHIHIPSTSLSSRAAHLLLSLAQVKTIGICVFNSMWVSKCFGKQALPPLKEQAVVCSGSTLGSYVAIHHYLRTMLQSMDTVKCWLKVAYCYFGP